MCVSVRERFTVLVLRPAIMLLDEPFSSVDELTREKLQNLLSELRSETGATLLLVTHNVEEAALLGGQILVLSKKAQVEHMVLGRPNRATTIPSPSRPT